MTDEQKWARKCAEAFLLRSTGGQSYHPVKAARIYRRYWRQIEGVRAVAAEEARAARMRRYLG